MNIDYNFTQKAKDYHSTLFIKLCIRTHKFIDLMIICTSTGRNSTTYEIFDENGDSMGERIFDCTFGPVARSFSQFICEDLNVLLDNNAWLNYAKFFPLAKLAVDKCESRYGNQISGGDCVIKITNHSNSR